MKVKELIAMLQEHNEEDEVILGYFEVDNCNAYHTKVEGLVKIKNTNLVEIQ